MAYKNHIDGPASTGGRVETSPASQRQTATGPVIANQGVGAGTPNRKKVRRQTGTGATGTISGILSEQEQKS